MVYSLGQHSYDADCNLFLRIFSGDVEEAVRQEQDALAEQARAMRGIVCVGERRDGQTRGVRALRGAQRG